MAGMSTTVCTGATGAGDLATGAGDLATGAGDLATGAGDLATGAGDLATGAGDLATGLCDAPGAGDGAGLCDAPGAGDGAIDDLCDLLDLVDNGPRLSGIIDVELVIELDA